MTEARLRFQPAVIPTLLTALGLVVLCGLGLWQVDRLAWKRALLDEIESQMAGEPVPLPEEISDPDAWNYRRVTATGAFRHADEVYVFAAVQGGGWHVYTPLIREDATPVWVNRGFVPDNDLRNPAERAEGLVDGQVTIEGIVRTDRQGNAFSPENAPAAREFFVPRVAALSAAVGLSDAVPVFVEADATPVPGGWPKGGVTRLDIPNDHLQYAVTWFGLAAVLLVIYVIFSLRRGQDRQGREDATYPS